MPSSFWSWTLAEFRDRVASSSPQPSGAPVASVGAAFGLGLVIMCLEITNKGAASDEVAAGRRLLERLSADADQDAAAYTSFMSSAALPKASEAERSLRKQRMQEALAAATETPLAAARNITEALALADRAAEISKAMVLNDLAAGVDLLTAGLSAVLRTVDVNLAELSDAGLQEHLRKERAALAASGAEHTAAALATIDARLQNR